MMHVNFCKERAWNALKSCKGVAIISGAPQLWWYTLLLKPPWGENARVQGCFQPCHRAAGWAESTQTTTSGRQALILPYALSKASHPHTKAPKCLCELDLWLLVSRSCSACSVATVLIKSRRLTSWKQAGECCWVHIWLSSLVVTQGLHFFSCRKAPNPTFPSQIIRLYWYRTALELWGQATRHLPRQSEYLKQGNCLLKWQRYWKGCLGKAGS